MWPFVFLLSSRRSGCLTSAVDVDPTRCSRHRCGPLIQVDHDIEQIRGVPEQLCGEVEVAVLEGVPMVREALLLHRPTGTVLSADLLLAMDKGPFVSFDPKNTQHISLYIYRSGSTYVQRQGSTLTFLCR